MKVLAHQYSNHFNNQKIAIIGPTPPPWGGISVHVSRVAEKLKNQGNRVAFFNPELYRVAIWRFVRLGGFLLRFRPTCVHYHVLYHGLISWLVLLFFKFLLRYRIVLVDHDCRFWHTASIFFKACMRATSGFVIEQVLIGNSTVRCYQDNKIPILACATIESPYLPPAITQKQAIWATYPAELHVFIAQHSPLLVANASRLVLFEGKDLYGLDTCIKLLREFKKYKTHNLNGAGFVFALGVIEDEAYWESVKQQIAAYGLVDDIFFLRGQKELWPLCASADLFIRPTLSDSYGISLAEAIAVGTLTLASDVCIRPAETVCYATHDFEDCLEKSIALLVKKQGSV